MKRSNEYYILIDDADLANDSSALSWESVCGAQRWIIDNNRKPLDEAPELLILLITSKGGDLSLAFSLIEVMKASRIPVMTVGMGEVCSSALLIFMAGCRGLRWMVPGTSILSHLSNWEPLFKPENALGIIEEQKRINDAMVGHYVKYTKKTKTKVLSNLLTGSDVYLTPEDAVFWGIADKVDKTQEWATLAMASDQ